VNQSLKPALFSAIGTAAAAAGNTLTLTVQGLQPDTDYFYGVEVGGVLRTEPASRGRLRTFPLGTGSFKIAFASCSDYRVPNQSAFDAIAEERPLMFFHMGDLHYNDTDSTNPEDYRENYDAVLNHPVQSALYRNVALAYMWDDHDFSGNDSDTSAIGRDAARTVYRERTPHYPIAAAGGTMAQSFTIGRVRVIMTDNRSDAESLVQAGVDQCPRRGLSADAVDLQSAVDRAGPTRCRHLGWLYDGAHGDREFYQGQPDFQSRAPLG
jgi:phosphodiesterase/alkaline phosphatase D-like protein